MSGHEFSQIGARLAAVRLAFTDLGQRQWAEINGFPYSRWNNWETGARRIPVDEAMRLCDTYGLSLDFVYLGRLDGLSVDAAKALRSHLPKT